MIEASTVFMVSGQAITRVAAVPQNQPGGSDAFGVTYFPGVAVRSRAVFLSLGPGEIREGLDFALPSPPHAAIAGVVTGVPADWGAHAVAVSIFGDDGWLLGTVSPDGEGRFTIGSVLIGSYQLVAQGPVIGSNDEGPLVRSGGRHGATNIVVTEGQMSEVQVSLRDLATVQGRVALETAGETRNCFSGSRLLLLPAGGPGNRFHAALEATGFTISEVPSGRYRLEIQDLQDGCYLKEVRVAGHKLEGS